MAGLRNLLEYDFKVSFNSLDCLGILNSLYFLKHLIEAFLDYFEIYS